METYRGNTCFLSLTVLIMFLVVFLQTYCDAMFLHFYFWSRLFTYLNYLMPLNAMNIIASWQIVCNVPYLDKSIF